jgi:hypothetical protein
MKKMSYFFILLMVVGFFIKPTYAADWRFPVGLTYVNGFGDVVDIYEDNLEAEGYIVDTSWEFPVGISFQPYVQLDNGLRFGAGVGPISFILSDEASFYNVPINVNVGYVFFPSANISPYVRGGLMYHIAGGDYVEGTSPGLFGGIGVEFLRKESVSFGVELSYDTSEIEFEKYSSNNYWWNSYKSGTKDIKPYGLMFSIFVVF